MELTLTRKHREADRVIGELFLNGAFECYTLEDAERPLKIAGVTAIPRGHYEIVTDFSDRFKKQTPRLLQVPDFKGIRIHSGHYCSNTDGCILVGRVKEDNSIGYCLDAFNQLLLKLQQTGQNEKITIQITG